MIGRMKRTWALLILAVCVAVLWVAALNGRQAPEPDARILVATLQATAGMWNRGDLEGFIAPYADATTFMTPAGLIGRDAMRARYVSKYFTGTAPDQHLRFDQLEVRPLGAGHALMTGRYALSGGGRAEQTGRFTLVWMRTPGGWRILHDHSS